METGLQTLRALSCCHPTFRPWQEIWDGQICQTLGPNPQAAPHTPDVCLYLFRFDRMLLCVRVRACEVCARVSRIACLIRFPCHGPGPGSITTERQRGESLPAILFLSHPSDLFLWYVKSVQWGKDSASIAFPRCVSGSNSSFSVFIPLSSVLW